MITPKELENEIEAFVERYSYNTDSVDIALNYCADNYKKLYDSYFQLIKDSKKSNAENQTIKNSLANDKKQLTDSIDYLTYLFELSNAEIDLLNKKFEEDFEKRELSNKTQGNFIINNFFDYIFYIIDIKQREMEAEKNKELFIPLIVPPFEDFLIGNKNLKNDSKKTIEIIEKMKSISNDTLKGFLDYTSNIVSIANLANEENDDK